MFNSLWASDFLIDTARNFADTTAIKLSNGYAEASLGDLIYTLPCHDLYGTWDTLRVHPYHFELKTMKDTVPIQLIEGTECGFMAPLMACKINSPFGWRNGRQHYGTDLDVEVGDSVSCMFDGVVRISHYSPSYGNVVVVRHYNGLETLYAHLNERKVEVGETVLTGQLLGQAGNTGHSTGPHLHLEMRYLGVAIDPATVLDFAADSLAPTKLKSDTFLVSSSTFAYLTPPKNASYSSGATYHTIKSGDTLGAIAIKYHTSVNRLCQLNRISRTTTLRLGRKLRVR